MVGAARALLVAASLCLVAAAAPAAAHASVYLGRDVPYVNQDGKVLRLDVWRDTARTYSPVIILLHGGGWRYGDKSAMNVTGWPRSLALRGYYVVNIDYRLACKLDVPRRGTSRSSQYPAEAGLCGHTMDDMADDVVAAVSWVRQNTYRRGANPNRIALVGVSAGGHLAALVGSDPRIGARVQAVAAYSPPIHPPWFGPRSLPISNALARAHQCWWGDCTSFWREHTPAEFVSGWRTPPTYLFGSVADDVAPVEQVSLYRGVLARQRVSSRFAVVDGRCHGPIQCDQLRVRGSGLMPFLDMVAWLNATV